MKKHRLGLVLGSFFALVHLIWVVLVLLGWAQSILNFVHRMHFISNSEVVLPFDFLRAIGLIALAWIIGYVVGITIEKLWKKFNRTIIM